MIYDKGEDGPSFVLDMNLSFHVMIPSCTIKVPIFREVMVLRGTL